MRCCCCWWGWCSHVLATTATAAVVAALRRRRRHRHEERKYCVIHKLYGRILIATHYFHFDTMYRRCEANTIDRRHGCRHRRRRRRWRRHIGNVWREIESNRLTYFFRARSTVPLKFDFKRFKCSISFINRFYIHSKNQITTTLVMSFTSKSHP